MTPPSRIPLPRRLPWTTLLLVPILATGGMAETPRGRDPWAFRLTLENKTRMLVAALRSDLWVAYNPANGTLHKVWSGGIQFRGKVYDFSQQNSATTGTTYHLLKKAFLLSATNESVIPPDWSAIGITTGASSWSLSTTAGTMLVSPAVDLGQHDRVILAYQTPGANNRLLVDVSTDNGATWTAQQWMSIDGAAADGHQKLIEVNGQAVKVRFRRNTTGATATLGDVTLFGDFRAWTMQTGGNPVAITVDWRGYKLVNHTDGIAIRYDVVLPDGSRVTVEERPEAMPGTKLQRKFTITGMPASSRLSLEIDGTGYQAQHSVTGGAALRTDAGATFLDFTANGVATLETTWTP
jgi:hypothetical protein